MTQADTAALAEKSGEAAAAPKAADALFEPIRRLGLERYVDQLAAEGYTVVPPEVVCPPGFIERMRDALLRVAERRTGVKHAVERNGDPGTYAEASRWGTQFIMWYLLFEDPVFEEWLENPVMHALVNHTLRGRAHLSHMASFVKWKGDAYGEGLGLHSDSPERVGLSGGFDGICNCTLVVTDYTREDGALAMVPGSQNHHSQPKKGEGVAEAIPIEAPAGSLIFFAGGVWHGAYPKTTDGLRLSVLTYFSDRMMKTLERYQEAVPREMLERHSDQFARYVGADDPWGRRAIAQPTYLKALGDF